MNEVIHGDSINELQKLKENSVDLLCTDPPYGYSFMGKSWDKTLPDIRIFKECLRVLKAGSFAFVMSAPRSDVCARMMLLLEDAGFNIGFTPIYWTYASGFPKALNIGKMVDKRKGLEREKGELLYRSGKPDTSVSMPEGEVYETKPVSEEAKALDGSYGGFQPKPAVEVVIVAMKPLSEKTFVDQALKNGKGITWLDDCRVPINGETVPRLNIAYERKGGKNFGDGEDGRLGSITGHESNGRFPANLLVSSEVLNGHSRFFSLDEWAQTLPFLAVPKASKREKNEGLESFEERDRPTLNKYSKPSEGRTAPKNGSPQQNFHPTVKPLTLMSYLITLGSRPGDVVLDPFLGSGTTALAAKQLGRKYVGVEREAEYVEIARARLSTQPAALEV